MNHIRERKRVKGKKREEVGKEGIKKKKKIQSREERNEKEREKVRVSETNY